MLGGIEVLEANSDTWVPKKQRQNNLTLDPLEGCFSSPTDPQPVQYMIAYPSLLSSDACKTKFFNPLAGPALLKLGIR